MLLTPHHRRSGRIRRKPKKYEDETFVSGAVDRYVQNYNGRFKETHWVAEKQDKDTYYENKRYNNFDYAESLLEFTSIWRDLQKELPGVLVENIGSYLNLRDTDTQKGMLAKDDEFIVNDLKEENVDEISDSDEEEFMLSESDTDISDWSSEDEDEYEDKFRGRCKLRWNKK